ncbi:glycine betaine/proline transport system permease protein [Sphaerotilus sulfidivorans]|jgi:glycine betaine/proline transport system permease protein|uniref:Glycine betaine/proline transport system permease protein n=1 Tax=Sphaerotilus sulfidivorans TaxID=639200 RepID=A0A5C1Q7N0_9BURK|nr:MULTISPECIES: proline/glycine betaine ABC transporter permease [Sphaerotilus]GIX53900.1 choline ABC transporter permease subunit [Sphaerotilus natans]MCK6403458.1 proline/glycine betaine ABC transporter permease [Sphaerotilus sulfidivorans]NZD46020.1 proline/glycine betaine ABC transporter permease [Sphaerotilus sulfidivorans]QEN03019.1 proline/glycine betaine ABC transporter permease [Sphaerotilus sulfidivorans]GKQ59018.1 choline ABC transporter permease subunit [Sphaerotilus sp. FB-3]
MPADFLQDLIGEGKNLLPLGALVNDAVKLLLEQGGGLFDVIGALVEGFASQIEAGLLAIPSWLVMIAVTALGVWRLNWRFGLFALASLLVIRIIGFWDQTAVTLALVFSATLISIVVGVPLGILSARSDRFNALLRPVLDFMQTMPAFVYLIPAAMLFGLGRVPGILATVVFAMPPVVRLTALGIRQVSSEQVEAGQAFGCTSMQLLWKVQLPIALPTLMAGVNQTIMMALSMVIIASMVGAGGLGNEVLSSIQRLDIGLGFESGLSVVLLAIILDRLTESFGARQQES